MIPGDPPSVTPSAPAEAGLPPVEPPSGRFIVQLFLVPGVIVLGVVLFLMAIFYYTTSRSPEYYLRQLDSDNADIRWRGASDLAQILKRPEGAGHKWKSDAHFALELAERLRTALDELRNTERTTAEKAATLPSAEGELAWRKVTPLRNHASFLASALGDFHVPVGVPLLAEMCMHDLADQGPDVKGNTLQRRKAIWSLANLGVNTRDFSKLSAEKQAEAIDVLRSEAAAATPRAAWARTALAYLAPVGQPVHDAVRVDQVLARCAEARDRYLREQVALAFNFWDGPLTEPTLLKLAHDDGHGTLLRVNEQE